MGGLGGWGGVSSCSLSGLGFKGLGLKGSRVFGFRVAGLGLGVAGNGPKKDGLPYLSEATRSNKQTSRAPLSSVLGFRVSKGF